jgi:hypothetical protein
MMLDSPHTSAPMLMRVNALLLKTPVENAPRTSIEKHLSWSPDIPPAAHFPLHRSRPAESQPNHSLREERGGRGTTSSRTTTRAANELSPPKSACAGDASPAPAPGAQSYWLSPITSFHHIGDNRYYRDILESVTGLTTNSLMICTHLGTPSRLIFVSERTN